MINKMKVKKGSILVTEIHKNFEISQEAITTIGKIFDNVVQKSQIELANLVIPENLELTIIEQED